MVYLVYTQLFAAAQNRPGSGQGIFRVLALPAIVLWSLYRIVWLLGTEGFATASSTVEVFLYLILDILAKIGFGPTNRGASGGRRHGAGGPGPLRREQHRTGGLPGRPGGSALALWRGA